MRLSKKEIKSEFSHYAMMFGVVPVYFNNADNVYCVRNWCPRIYSEFILFLVSIYWVPVKIINPKVEPKIWFRLSNKI